MAKHIHIHVTRSTMDAGPAHDPSNGQFTAGPRGTGAKPTAGPNSPKAKAFNSSALKKAKSDLAQMESMMRTTGSASQSLHKIRQKRIAELRATIANHERATKDADPSGIKRDADGKFATSSGGAAHHAAAAAKHDATRQGLPSRHDDKHDHMKASMRHEEAALYLKHAQTAHEAGHSDLAAEHHKTAEALAQQAKAHEAKLSSAVAPAGSKPKLKLPATTAARWAQMHSDITHDPSRKWHERRDASMATENWLNSGLKESKTDASKAQYKAALEQHKSAVAKLPAGWDKTPVAK